MAAATACSDAGKEPHPFFLHAERPGVRRVPRRKHSSEAAAFEAMQNYLQTARAQQVPFSDLNGSETGEAAFSRQTQILLAARLASQPSRGNLGDSLCQCSHGTSGVWPSQQRLHPNVGCTISDTSTWHASDRRVSPQSACFSASMRTHACRQGKSMKLTRVRLLTAAGSEGETKRRVLNTGDLQSPRTQPLSLGPITLTCERANMHVQHI